MEKRGIIEQGPAEKFLGAVFNVASGVVKKSRQSLRPAFNAARHPATITIGVIAAVIYGVGAGFYFG